MMGTHLWCKTLGGGEAATGGVAAVAAALAANGQIKDTWLPDGKI